MSLTQAEKDLIARIKGRKRYTVTRFELRSSREDSLISTALNHVHLETPEDTMEQAKENAAMLAKLAGEGVLHICYRVPVSARSDYQVYYDSALFAQLQELVEEGKARPDFLFDTAHLKRGVVTVTAKGRQAFYE